MRWWYTRYVGCWQVRPQRSGERCGRGRSADCASEARSADWYELIPEHSGRVDPRRARLRHQVTCSLLLRHYIAIPLPHVCQCVFLATIKPFRVPSPFTTFIAPISQSILSGRVNETVVSVENGFYYLNNNRGRKTWSTGDLTGWNLGHGILFVGTFKCQKL